ncbi:MAG TPA: hypothetical protein VKZ77_12755 [Bacillaceae bacterium]|nr:hypothetical protein [Paenibacillus bovis]HLU23326.1 hypothetical protein [Bacillaceae bacterium]
MVFDWDINNIEHIGEQDVEPFEAEEVFDDVHRRPFSAHSGRSGVLGETEVAF